MNPRYVAYATAHGRSPEDMAAHDEEAWPGGCMTGYIIWIGERWREWDAENPDANPRYRTKVDHAEFDAWLAAR